MNKHKILLLEDDESLGGLLSNYLSMSDYECVWVKNGLEALAVLKEQDFDLCISDVMMPEMDGFSFAARLQKENKRLKMIFLTAKHQKEDLIQGYTLGAVDYIAKPFDVEILVLKIQALLSEHKTVLKEEEALGQFLYNKTWRKLSGPDFERRLSPKESDLLELLLKYKNEIMPREIALAKIWKEESYFTTRSMDVYIAKLRKYLQNDPQIIIENVPNSGYILRV